MIFERRAYTIRPGKVDAFWQAQMDWNTPDKFSPILAQTIGYFRTLAGPASQIVHLYRFDDLDHWQSIYARYYAVQNPDYFAYVRPLMLQQENAFLAEPPHPHLHAGWTAEGAPRLPAVLAPKGKDDPYCLVETTTSFLPGGLPAYWKAYEAHRAGKDPAAASLMAELVSLIGRLHRVLRYEAFATPADAHAALAARRTDPAWQAFVAAQSDWVAAEETILLEPTPLPSRRFLTTQA